MNELSMIMSAIGRYTNETALVHNDNDTLDTIINMNVVLPTWVIWY